MSISLTSEYCLERILSLLLDGLFTKKVNANKTEVRKIAI